MKRILVLLVLLMALASPLAGAASSSEPQQLIELTWETKQSLQQKFINDLVSKYNNDETFLKLHQYMIVKYQDLAKKRTPRQPDVIIRETFQKTQMVYEKTKGLVGNSFQNFDPESVEKSVEKFLWLKGVCFLILGIGEEHQIGLSYFYRPENVAAKQELLRDIVHYSFPEVPDVPANGGWYRSMVQVMDRLGYQIFNVKKYCPEGWATVSKQVVAYQPTIP